EHGERRPVGADARRGREVLQGKRLAEVGGGKPPPEPVGGKPPPELQQLVAESDTGGRKVGGFAGKLIFAVAVGWSLFQLWYAWLRALAGAFAGMYFILYYADLAARPGQPILIDKITATVGLLVLLEATRRAVGLPMAILAILFLAYILLGRHLPDVLAHKGA